MSFSAFSRSSATTELMRLSWAKPWIQSNTLLWLNSLIFWACAAAFKKLTGFVLIQGKSLGMEEAETEASQIGASALSATGSQLHINQQQGLPFRRLSQRQWRSQEQCSAVFERFVHIGTAVWQSDAVGHSLMLRPMSSTAWIALGCTLLWQRRRKSSSHHLRRHEWVSLGWPLDSTHWHYDLEQASNIR